MSGTVRWAIVVTSLVVAVGLMAAVSGCSLDRAIRVHDVPAAVQRAADIPANPTLAEARAAWPEWIASVERDSQRFQGAITEAEDRYAVLASLLRTGLEDLQIAASGPLAAVPGGGVLLTGLGLVGGLFLKRPGEAKAVDAAYDLGAKEAVEQFKRGLESTKA